MCDLRGQIVRGRKREVMYTPLDLYFLMCIVALWRSGENIASIDRILHTKEHKTMLLKFTFFHLL